MARDAPKALAALTSALLAAVDAGDDEAAAVAADALEERGDPRGRLHAVQRALEDDPWNAELQREDVQIVERNAEGLLGPLALCRWDDGLSLTWRRGFLREAVIEERERDPSVLLDRLLGVPCAEALEAVRVGHTRDFLGCAAVLVAHRPLLRRLFFGIAPEGGALFEYGHLGALLTALPELEVFEGSGGSFDAIDLPRVRSFALHTTAADLDPLCAARWPRLEHLRLGGTTASDLYPRNDVRRLIDALVRVPTLRALELVGHEDPYDEWRDVTSADDVLVHCASSPLLAQLDRLVLDGPVSAMGAQAILEAAPAFAHVELVLGRLEGAAPVLEPSLKAAVPRFAIGRT